MILLCRNCGQKNRVGAAHLSAHVRCGKCRTAIGPITAPIDVDAAAFDELLRDARVPILVDFWADWCGPCRMAAPEVQQVAEQMSGRAIVIKVDSDRYPEIAARYRVQGIPNFVVLKAGVPVHQQAGVVPHAEMIRWLEQALRA